MAGKGLPGPLRLLLVLSLVVKASFFFVFPTVVISSSSSSSLLEGDTLLQFKSTLSSTGGEVALRSWTPGSSPCNGNTSNWGSGVLCYNGYVWGLQLEGMGFSGKLSLDSLVSLPGLRTLSFMDNSFVGPMPEISKLGALKNVYLSDNQFSGEIADDMFDEMRSLKKVYRSGNDFSGKIPSSLTVLHKLLQLRLDGNQFDGVIPDLRLPGLELLNVSYNKLQGKIPEGLTKLQLDPSCFQGNEMLCGAPLDVECETLSPSALPTPKRKSSSTSPSSLPIIIVLILVLTLLALAYAIFVTTTWQRKSRDDQQVLPATACRGITKDFDDVVEAVEQGAANAGGGGVNVKKSANREIEQGKLSFVRESRDKFELQDLLKASAEVLGSGNFGSSYKAVLLNGPWVVVKRFKEMNGVGKEDFMEHMRRLGRLSHPHLLPLVAYYYRKEEKLLLTDYIPNGSLAHMLHGNRGSNLPPLEWPTRLRIIKGVARGLAYLYEELPVLTLPHGHLKSSNVLVDDNYEALLTDYALVPVMNRSHASQVMVAYKTPEVTQTGRPSKKSDVWSLGILILEILTGKFPATYLQKGGKGLGFMDLEGWVNSLHVLKEEDHEGTTGGGEMISFDREMKVLSTKSSGAGSAGEMSKLLQIGLGCCKVDVDKRLEKKDALEKIEGLREYLGDDHDNSNSFVISETYSSVDI